jgi:peptidoglycan/LPS O-acetylase OafA/YrhL
VTGELARAPQSGRLDHRDHLRFDALRGLMAILVLFSHASQIFLWRLAGSTGSVAILAKQMGRGAVIVFFLLSGYLITQSVCRNIARRGAFDAMEYVTTRLARIYPPLIGALLLTGLVWAVIHGAGLAGAVSYGLPGDLYKVRDSFSISPDDLLSALFMQAGFVAADGSLWTLYLEVHLYTAILAFAAWRMPNWGARILCLVAGAAGLYAMRFAIPLACIWFIGAAFALWPPGRKAGLALAAAGALATLAIAVLRPELFGLLMDTGPGEWAQVAPSVAIAALMFAAPPRWYFPPALARTGDFSYSLYVIHWPLMMLALSLAQPWMQHSVARALAVAAGSILIVLPASFLFARVLERPKFFARMLRGALSPPAAQDSPAGPADMPLQAGPAA